MGHFSPGDAEPVTRVSKSTAKEGALSPALSCLDEWQRTFDAISDIITIQTPDLRIVKANLTTGQTFGVPPQDLIGKYCYELFRGSRVPCEGCPATETLHSRKTHSAEIFQPGLCKTFTVSTSPLFDSNGDIVHIIHWAKDITEKKNLQRQLLHAQKMEAIGTLASGIAHDFNNILTAIIGYGELANEILPIEHQASRDIGEILKAGDRAKKLVQQILAIGRETEPSLELISLQHVIREVVLMLRASLPTTIEFSLEIDESCGPVQADPVQMHQVIMNLCTNAYHAMRLTGGILEISLQTFNFSNDDVVHKFGLAEGPYACLRISDTGSGIAKEHLGRIFDPYFSTKRKGEGTGLGLSMVQSIVKSHDGQISVYSETGKGSTFTVFLPHCRSYGTLEQVSAKHLPVSERGSERILLLDDEEQIVTIHSRFLQSLGYQVEGFSSCKDAILAFRASHTAYDLIITDMTMPHLTGIEFAAEIKQFRPDIPIIICTGFSDHINQDNLQTFGIGKLLLKPVTFSTLGRAVRELLDNR